MTKGQVLWCVLVLSIVLLVVVVFWPLRKAPAPSESVFAMAAGLAIGIERTLEVLWTIIGQISGPWWPLSVAGREIKAALSRSESAVAKFLVVADGIVKELEVASPPNQTAAAARRDLNKMSTEWNTLLTGSYPLDNQRITLLTGVARTSLRYLEKKYPEFQTETAVAYEAINGTVELAGSFKDNPNRRLISIYAGAILGLILAAALKLDIFGSGAHWGVALTGIVMGLGSNPTHEAIRAVQEYKKARKTSKG